MRKLVLIEPEIPENTGSIARLAANFYFELRIVNPQFNLAEARKTAKNAQNKLRDARIYEKVEEAVQFQRKGYFCVDRDSTENHLIFNRTVTLRDNWKGK